MPRPALEVAQIFRHHGPEYRQNHGLSPEQHQARRDIERCRTSSLGSSNGKNGSSTSKSFFNGSQKAYHYLSCYTHRVAISNHRLVSLTYGKVTFRARDNSRPGQQRLVTTTAQEFIRRFLAHPFFG